MPMRLTTKERRVLAAALLNRRDSAPEIARRAGVPAHTVAYTLRKLQERKVIRPFTMMNLHAFGLTDYCVFFNVISDAKRVRNQVLDYCVHSHQTTYVAELSGIYQFSTSIFARSIVEVENFFVGLMHLIPHSSIEMSFGIRSQWSILPIKYLDPLSKKLKPLNRFASQPELDLDEIDTQILTELSDNPEVSLSRLGTIVGLGASAIHYRLDSLKKRGVILGYAYCVDGASLGRTPFRILMVTRGLQKKLQEELFNFACGHELCTMFVRCLGAWDFEMNFDLETPEQGGEVVQQVYDNFGSSIQSTRTVTELVICKVHTFPTRTPESSGVKPSAVQGQRRRR